MDETNDWRHGPDTARGTIFEGFVKGMFPATQFKILLESEGRGSKVPDFYIKDLNKGHKFWVEAKNRRGFYLDKIAVFGDRPDRLNILHAFQGIVLPESVFVVLGVGEDPASPDTLFRIPVKEMRYASLRRDFLKDWTCGRSFTRYDNYKLMSGD
jgi:hypothetical protein